MSDTTLEHHVHRRCGGHFVRVDDETTVRVSGMSARVPRSIFRCDRCGDEQFTVEQREAVEKQALVMIREANGLLAPKEIKALRERLGLTPAQLGELVYGVPKGLIEGWEKGRYLQNRVADAVLRSLEDRDELERRATRAGVTLPVPAGVGADADPAPSADASAPRERDAAASSEPR
ncbi:MAG TPA: type II TA system antitoxin MqsA family protein [Gemmatimonadaceae bacterium]|nr:type II TA system antitoxin MqsA family protein [Gemmatimonadaceae bacterium]